MIVAEDLYGADGRILLKRGTALDSWYIERLQGIRQTTLLVDDLTPVYLDNHYIAHQIRHNGMLEVTRWLPDGSTAFQQAWEPLERVIETIHDEPELTGLLLRLSQRQRQWFLHGVQRAALGVVMARELPLAALDRQSLVMALLLLDIGNLGLSDEIATKSTPLTATERKLVHLHPELAVERLQKIATVAPQALQVVHCHHERLDGSGYPRGLVGHQIDPLSQVAAIADVYCALGQDRSHRCRIAPATRDSILRDGAGTLFDATLIADFLARPHGSDNRAEPA
ncbi:MAG: HD domain-containing protein [Candidatus Sericytochromatia bacterium]|nr:HD domain-containing protein [Candidatus Sericytochromatia bacterium]